MGDIGMAMQHAQDKTEQMQARASALDELMASGAPSAVEGASGNRSVKLKSAQLAEQPAPSAGTV